jgi:hypothetical protein
MLLEGTSCADVSKFIQDDQKSLTDVNFSTLTNVLIARKRLLQDKASRDTSDATAKWFEANGYQPPEPEPEPEDGDEGLDDEDSDERIDALQVFADNRKYVPSAFAKQIYERAIKDGIEELVELEAMYRTQRHRVDRLVEIETAQNGYIEGIAKEMSLATDTLMKRVAVKEKLGLIDGDSKFRDQLDIKGYSENTTEVLSNPESRHRVIALIERIKRNEEKKQKEESAAKDVG